MGVQIPSGYGQANHVFSLSGKTDRMVCTIGYALAGGIPDPANAALQQRNLWASAGCPFDPAIIGVGYTYEGCQVTEVYDDQTFIGEYMNPAPGTAVGERLPPNCSWLVKKVTGRGGRAGRGRMFLPPMHPAEGGVDALGVIGAGAVTTQITRFNTVMGYLTASTRPPRLLHENPALAPDAITAMIPQALIATQRRRLR